MLQKRGGVCGVARVFAWVELADVNALPNRGLARGPAERGRAAALMLKKRGGICCGARVFAWGELPDVIALPNRGAGAKPG